MSNTKILFVRKKESKFIKPYNKMRGLVYTRYFLDNLDNFKHKTEEYFTRHNGTFLLYNEENKPVIKFEIKQGKMTQIFKTGTNGSLYPLWQKWKWGYIRI